MKPAHSKPVIELVNLCKYYGDVKAVDNVSMRVEKGEIFGFIGPNGAGKSTTIRTLLGLLSPTSGQAKLFGRNVSADNAAVREEVGYLPSEVFYYDGMRVNDLLRYAASFYQKPQDEMMQRARQLADRLSLDISRKIDDLSYGNKKKVGIVQGLLHSPQLIILDEPTGGLDPLMQQTFFELLEEEQKRGATILFSSHILSEVQKLCDRVAIIKQGRLVGLETVKQLRASSYLKCRLETKHGQKRIDLKLPGMTHLETGNGTASFLYRGDVTVLMKRLATLHLKNCWLEEPELEEIFLHYYQTDTTD